MEGGRAGLHLLGDVALKVGDSPSAGAVGLGASSPSITDEAALLMQIHHHFRAYRSVRGCRTREMAEHFACYLEAMRCYLRVILPNAVFHKLRADRVVKRGHYRGEVLRSRFAGEGEEAETAMALGKLPVSWKYFCSNVKPRL